MFLPAVTNQPSMRQFLVLLLLTLGGLAAPAQAQNRAGATLYTQVTGREVRVAVTFDIEAGCPHPTSYCVAAPNSVGPGATIGFEGSGSESLENLALTVTGGPSPTTAGTAAGGGHASRPPGPHPTRAPCARYGPHGRRAEGFRRALDPPGGQHARARGRGR